MLRGIEGDLGFVEYLVLMRINHDMARACLWSHEAVPIPRKILKCVMNHNHCIDIYFTNGFVTCVIKGFHAAEKDRIAIWIGFVEQFNGRYNVSGGGVAFRERLEGHESLTTGVSLLPCDSAQSTGIVEAIL